MNESEKQFSLRRAGIRRVRRGNRPRENDSRAFWGLVSTKARGVCSIKSGGKGHNPVTAGLGRALLKNETCETGEL